MSQPSTAPVLATAVVREIKSFGCSLWLIQKFDSGLWLRCERGPAQFRVILPPLFGAPVEVPQEGRIPSHVVRDLDTLRGWLQSLLSTQNG
jgi:hypothetical protein